MAQQQPSFQASIAPWLTVKNGSKALNFYKAAFGAIETYRLEIPGGGLVVKLSVDGAEFWLSSDNSADDASDARSLKCDNIRMILTTNHPDALFAKALAEGATEIFPIAEQHGWRLGRLVDPLGLHWEIGHPLL